MSSFWVIGGAGFIALISTLYFMHDTVILVSRGFAQSFGSGGEAEGLHFVGVLPFDDEFREDVALVGIEKKFGQPMA
jgi:hypothetical protein